LIALSYVFIVPSQAHENELFDSILSAKDFQEPAHHIINLIVLFHVFIFFSKISLKYSSAKYDDGS